MIFFSQNRICKAPSWNWSRFTTLKLQKWRNLVNMWMEEFSSVSRINTESQKWNPRKEADPFSHAQTLLKTDLKKKFECKTCLRSESVAKSCSLARPLQSAIGIQGSPALGHAQIGLHFVHVLLEAGQQTEALPQVSFAQGLVEILEGWSQRVVLIQAGLSIQASLLSEWLSERDSNQCSKLLLL